ncbi:MAG: hypothetical protein H6Q15_1115 [Bacteroidetes bacterium]|nr:hypothetical protein [Bacteroidota bacterium]
MRKNIILIFVLLLNITLFASPTKKKKIQEIKIPKMEIDTIFQQVDTLNISLIIYKPINHIPSFTTSRPDSCDTNIKLSVAAAFTGKNLRSIMGNHVINGRLKKGYKEPATGYAAIIGNNIIINPINKNLKYYQKKAINKKGDLFRQMLLVYDSTIIPCTIFGNLSTFRRALVLVDKTPWIIESEQRMTIEDFSKALLRMGIRTALCLDMGTWSHGWVRTEENSYTQIGKLTSSTKNQTNWLIFTE